MTGVGMVQAADNRPLVHDLGTAREQIIDSDARNCGRNRTEFYKLLNEHHLDPAEFRAAKSESAGD